MAGFFGGILGFLTRRGVKHSAPPTPGDVHPPFHFHVVNITGGESGESNNWKFTDVTSIPLIRFENIFLHENY